jgi:hypothetical protein
MLKYIILFKYFILNHNLIYFNTKVNIYSLSEYINLQAHSY